MKRRMVALGDSPFWVCMESLSGFPAQVAGVYQLPQQATAAILRILEALVQHIERAHDGIQADQVRRFERPHRVCEALLEDLIDRSAVATLSWRTKAASFMNK